MRLRTSTLLGCFAAWSAIGCNSGGQTGDLSGNSDNGGETAADGCIAERQELASLSEASPLGFSAEDVLAFAERSFEAPLTWKEVPSVAYGPEHGESSLTIDLARGESAYYVTYRHDDTAGSGIEIYFECPEPHLSIDVHASVSSEGGALAEVFDASLHARTTELATLSKPLEQAELGGSFAVSSFARPRTELVQLTLDVSLTAAGASGSLGGTLQTTGDSVTSASPAQFAVWPDSPACQSEQGANIGLPIAAEDAALGTTGAAALELLEGLSPTDASWEGGGVSELTFTASALGDGCLRQEPYSGPGTGALIATYPISIVATTDDGKLAGEYTGTLRTSQVEGELWVSANVSLPLELEQLAQSGLVDAVVPTDADRLHFELNLESHGEAFGGSLSLRAFTDPPCLTDPPPPPEPTPGGGMSVPGCEGSRVTVLEAATWGEPVQ